MQNVVLVVHLILALCLIGVVLLQRSEGERGAATALSKVTWALAIGFLTTSMTLTILAGGGGSSVLDLAPVEADGTVPLPVLPGAENGADLLPGLPATPPATSE
jgi:preprotein translocase subunit SecG